MESCPEIPLCLPAPMAGPPWQCLCGVCAQPSRRAYLGVSSPGVLYLSILVDAAQTQKGQRVFPAEVSQAGAAEDSGRILLLPLSSQL